MAQREGFEPPDSCPSTVFKTAAFDRSAISAFLLNFTEWENAGVRRTEGVCLTAPPSLHYFIKFYRAGERERSSHRRRMPYRSAISALFY